MPYHDLSRMQSGKKSYETSKILSICILKCIQEASEAAVPVDTEAKASAGTTLLPFCTQNLRIPHQTCPFPVHQYFSAGPFKKKRR